MRTPMRTQYVETDDWASETLGDLGVVFYFSTLVESFENVDRCVWIVPAPCYPAPDVGAVCDAIRHAR